MSLAQDLKCPHVKRQSQKNCDDDDADDDLDDPDNDLDNVDDDGEPDVTCARVSPCEEREQEKLKSTSSLNLGLE